MRLDEVPLDQTAVITRIDWTALGERAARRLRALGFDVDAEVQPLHRGVLWSSDPVAVRIGRMTVALRKVQAEAIEVCAK
jgi:ferrous iron transport protein A